MFTILKKKKSIGFFSYSSYASIRQSRAATYFHKDATYGLLKFIQELTVPEKTFCMTGHEMNNQ